MVTVLRCRLPAILARITVRVVLPSKLMEPVYSSIKNSNGAQNTFVAPTGKKIYQYHILCSS